MFLTGCATTQSSTRVSSTPPIQQPASTSGTTDLLKRMADVQEFTHVAWPTKPDLQGNRCDSVIESGINDEGVWVEGRGYFKGSLDKVYDDFMDPNVMGPTYMTKDIVVDHVEKSPVLSTYTMHIKMRYIMSVEFDLGVSIDGLYDGEGNRVGLLYRSWKTDGTRFITRIDEAIVIRQLEDGWFSAEFQSLNVATMNKEEETRKHLESLFAHWNETMDCEQPQATE